MKAGCKPRTLIRRLTRALIWSGVLNIAFLTWTCYNLIASTPYYQISQATLSPYPTLLVNSSSGREVFEALKSMSFDHLLAKLQNKQLVESGLTERDIALGCLVKYHSFDLHRSLRSWGQNLQERTVMVGGQTGSQAEHLTLFIGLTDSNWDEVIQFAKTERFPFTSRGLFEMLQKEGDFDDIVLARAFFHTHEFQTLRHLFPQDRVDRTEILSLLLEGDWEMVEHAIAHTPKNRQEFLLKYLAKGSISAAYIVLKTDHDFITNKLDDVTVLTLLEFIRTKTPEGEAFVQDLLKSPRSDAVWALAATRLEEWGDSALPVACVQEKIVKQLIQESVYIVQQGDSLWKIARKHHTSIDQLKQKNHLSSDLLQPGIALRIPNG